MAQNFQPKFKEGYFETYSTSVIPHADVNANEERYQFYEKLARAYAKGQPRFPYTFSVKDYKIERFNEIRGSKRFQGDNCEVGRQNENVESSKMTTPLSPADATTERRRRTTLILALLSVLLYGVSFLLPTYIGLVFKGKADFERGYTAFFMAAISPFSDWVQDPWIFAAFLANPLLWFSAGSFGAKRYLASWIAGCLAIGLSVPLWFKIHEWLLIGYYVWVLSIALLSLAGTIAWINSRQRATPRGFEVIV